MSASAFEHTGEVEPREEPGPPFVGALLRQCWRRVREHMQEAIREADELARRVGVEGVPFFVINARVTLSGAQPPDAFLAAFKEASGSS